MTDFSSYALWGKSHRRKFDVDLKDVKLEGDKLRRSRLLESSK